MIEFTSLSSLNKLLSELKLALPGSSDMSKPQLMCNISFIESEIEKGEKGLPCGFLFFDPKSEGM
jgi:hypothetical protein